MVILDVCKYSLKCLFPPPKFKFKGFDRLKLILLLLSSYRRPNSTSLAENAQIEPFTCILCVLQYDQKGMTRVAYKNVEPIMWQTGYSRRPHSYPILTIFGMLCGPLGMFVKFEFQKNSPQILELWVSKLPSFSLTRHIAYTKLVARAQAGITDNRRFFAIVFISASHRTSKRESTSKIWIKLRMKFLY